MVSKEKTTIENKSGGKMSSEKFKKLGEKYWEYLMQENPVWATWLGDNRYNDKLGEMGPASRQRHKAKEETFLKELQTIERHTLSKKEKISYRILEQKLKETLEGYTHPDWEWDIKQLFGPHIRLMDLLEIHPLKTKKNYDDLLSRYEKMPKLFDEYMGDLKEGLKSGRVTPKVAYDRVLEQLKSFTALSILENPFSRPLKQFPKTISSPEQKKFLDQFEKAIREKVVPAYQKFYDFLQTEYKGKARNEVGVSAIPGGREYYNYQARVMTTTHLTPEALHQMGLDELQKNQEEMKEIASRLGHTGDLKSFQEKIKADPSNYFKDAKELIQFHKDALNRMEKALPDYFGTLPKIPFEIKEIDALKAVSSPAAYYYPPTEDGSRGGIFWMNTLKPTVWARYSMETLAFHEAIPGHHLQIALATEQKELPKFQRHMGFTAYIEGWAHYTERLADDMGLYSTELDRFGMLMDQAWRAIRLVVDTGVHMLGWSRERALKFMAQTRTANEMEMNNEIDRYIVWPGQALAYKVGQCKFSDLRASAKEKMGNAFDLKKFHDTVLLTGPLPLTILEEVTHDWMDGKS